MAGVVLGPVRSWSSLCPKSMRLVEGSVLVPWSSPLVSPSARYRRSARVSPESKPEVEDDRWGRDVSDCVVQKWIFLFSGMNE